MLLQCFVDTQDISEEEYNYLISIAAEEELTFGRQKMIELIDKNYKKALETDRDENWDKLRDSIVKFHLLGLKKNEI